MDPVSAFGLVASVVQTISTVAELIKYASTVKHASEEQARLAREAASFVAFLTKFHHDIQRYDLSQPQFAGLRHIASEDGLLTDVHMAVFDLLRKLKRRRRVGKFIRSLAWPLDKREVDDLQSLIQRLTACISLALAQDNM